MRGVTRTLLRSDKALLLGGVFVLSVLFSGATLKAKSVVVTDPNFCKNQINFENEPLASRGISKTSARWVKFIIFKEPYDPNLVYFQDSRKYDFHYEFATTQLSPFLGMTQAQFNNVTLYSEHQQAILGTVILPPLDSETGEPMFQEYGIQFIGQEPYPREQIRELFDLVRANVVAPNDVRAYYFPTYEQQALATQQSDWFSAQSIALGSTARWATGDVCYADGWALGRIKYVPVDDIVSAYDSGELLPTDILLTNAIPAELPYVAGILSLAPSTPNSHVAILSRTYKTPFAYLALAQDANLAQQLDGHRVICSAYANDLGGCDFRLYDVNGLVSEDMIQKILALKAPKPLDYHPMQPFGSMTVPVEGLGPNDVQYVGGKASNFGILRAAIPDHSPCAIALTFDLWNQFMDQPVNKIPFLSLAPGQHLVVWADNKPSLGSLHTNFKLDKDGEAVALYDRDGVTPLDVVQFGPQTADTSWGRSRDGDPNWIFFNPSSPGQANSSGSAEVTTGLVINEFMADNKTVVLDVNAPDEHPDWIELYNGSDQTIRLNGLYLTDDVNDPTKWQFPEALPGSTLRQAIDRQLAVYPSYPPSNLQQMAQDLVIVRQWFLNADITHFDDATKAEILTALTDPNLGFDPNAMLRFRSSTNMEDSADFSGAGLYASHSGCLTDSLDGNSKGPCHCDPNKGSEHTVFDAIRKTFSSFYNDNAFLERLRHNVDENEVGMAVVVQHSFPDDIELANGVATITSTSLEDNLIIHLVTQPGAVSVTNPVDSSIPEQLTVVVYPNGTIIVKRPDVASSRLPLGATVMTWRDDYKALAELLVRVNDQFREVTGKTQYVLDSEYKLMAPGGAVLPAGGLVVKQVRQVPTASADEHITPFLVNQPLEFEVYTGEMQLFGPTDVFADHRLKSRWQLQTQSMVLDSNNLDAGLYTDLTLEYLDANQVRTITTKMPLLPDLSHGFGESTVVDRWRMDDVNNPRQMVLSTPEVPTEVGLAENPILTLANFGDYAYNLPYRCLTLDVTYQNAVPSWQQQLWSTDGSSGLRSTTTNTVYLWSPPAASSDDVYEERQVSDQGITIHTSFYFPPPPQGFPDWRAHTAPLLRWGQTVIKGLTTEPIVLKGFYSQTYRPEHHNMIENFLFEPRLEPGISTQILDELKAQDIRLIQWTQDNSEPQNTQVVTYGY